MTCIDIRGIKITGSLEYIMNELEEEATIKHPVRDEEKYEKYLQALSKLGIFQGKAKVDYDDPEKKEGCHYVFLEIHDSEWEGSQKEKLIDFLNIFDGIYFDGGVEDITSIMCYIKNIYREK